MRRFHSSIFLPSRQIVVRVIRTYSIAVTSVSYDDSVAVALPTLLSSFYGGVLDAYSYP